MGTRNLTMVKAGGEIKIAQYGQWNGQPTGQGQTIKHFLKTADLQRFTEIVKNTRFIDEAGHEELMESIGLGGRDLITMEERNLINKTFPTLSRDIGAKVLQIVLDDPNAPLENDYDLGYEPLFCEWGYLIDLDLEQVTIFRGSQDSPLLPGERFYTEKPGINVDGTDYYGIRAVRTFSIPTYKSLHMDELWSMIEEQEEKDD